MTVNKTLVKMVLADGKESNVVFLINVPDNAPTEIPEEFLNCLLDDPAALKTFLNYTDGQQKEFIDWIYSAKTDDTKIERIAETLHKLARKKKLRY